MSDKDDGGVFTHGASLREWYAGMALQGLLADEGSTINYEIIAARAFEIADAMIKESQK